MLCVDKRKKISGYLSGQFTQTIYDITRGNNPWGIGAGLQAFLNNASKFKPTIEVTADGYIAGQKYLYLIDGRDVAISGGVINVFGGATFHPTRSVYFSFVAGPSFINGFTRFGIKPSFGWYFSPSKQKKKKLSYINIYDREPTSKQDFGYVSLSIGLKLF
jgi:hypothetical protein